MRRIETNFIIYDLAKKGIKKPGLSFLMGLNTIIFSNITFLNLILLNSNLRYDLSRLYQSFEFYFVLLAIYLLGTLGCCLCYMLINPDKNDNLIFKIGQFIFYSVWLGLLIVSFTEVYSIYMNGQLLESSLFSWEHMKIHLSVFFFSFFILFYFVKKGYCFKKYLLIITMVLSSLNFASIVDLFLHSQTVGSSWMLGNILSLPFVSVFCFTYFIFRKNKIK